MCGRLNVTDDPLCRWVSEELGLEFAVPDNQDLRPTQAVGTIAQRESGLAQVDTHWGIKPDWAKRIIINATVERVATAWTFKSAFTHSRCVVPCTGFYEWKRIDTQSTRKQKYLFSRVDGRPLYMAGLLLGVESTHLVTLTMPAPDRFADIHDRFPLFVEPHQVGQWVSGTPEAAGALMGVKDREDIVPSPSA
ncbi:SOS response-associated peptidase [Marinimicrobium sp. ABcell2]|uniref:SOS response-associated peptidase n=1 Tax=Marinimicrobium sp. ABcell2 TaxID=3069751 RepID=UPI0027AFDDF3|nr:SOS response-associated peptidase family protein [Marinimicrobium sp. ABcell2]MDQ2077512.1 SOS response-associated peptidase family protein [Marinimicrobium sp. ABcell2]